MVLFTGPLYSGRQDAAKAWAEANGTSWADLRVCEDPTEVLKNTQDLAAAAIELATAYDIILYTEVGSGLVPVDETDRLHRETSGRLSILLAEQADEVYRVVAGLAKRLK